MRRFTDPVALSLVPLAFSIPSEAENAEDRMRQGYVFAAPGALTALGVVTPEVGGGFQWTTHRGLSLGLDGSLMGFPECFSCGGRVLGSLDAGYHFVRSSRRLAPFVLVGLGGILTGEEGVPLASFGGGFNYWFDNGRALRFEVRDRFISEGVHNLGMRLGVTF